MKSKWLMKRCTEKETPNRRENDPKCNIKLQSIFLKSKELMTSVIVNCDKENFGSNCQFQGQGDNSTNTGSV